MGDVIKDMLVQGGILALIAIMFGIVYFLVKMLVAAVDSDRLRVETRMAAAEKRVRLIFEHASFEVRSDGPQTTLRIPIKNIGKSDAADVWIRSGVKSAQWWLRPRLDETWFPLLMAGNEQLIDSNLGEPDPAGGRTGILIELSYRDYGEVARREWHGYHFEIAQPSGAVAFRVNTVTRMFRFRRLRGWRL